MLSSKVEVSALDCKFLGLGVLCFRAETLNRLRYELRAETLTLNLDPKPSTVKQK